MKPLLILTLGISLITSCAPVYIPNVANVPLLSQKGELQVAVHAGTAGIDPQVAYAITNTVGIMANGSFRDSKSSESNDFHNHNFGELGIGYYTQIDETGRFEVFSGFGLGETNSQIISTFSNRVHAKYNKFFIQPSIGLTQKSVDFSFSTRYIFVSVNDLSNSNFDYTRSFIEPIATLKLGGNKIKAVVQLGLSLPINDKGSSIDFQPLLLSIGVHSRLGEFFNKKE